MKKQVKYILLTIIGSLALLLLTAQTVLPGGPWKLANIANASLPTCAALYNGAIAWDTTNNCISHCDGSNWLCTVPDNGADWNFAIATNQTTGTGLIAQTTTVNAGTYHSANFATDVTGVGGGNFVLGICSDGATCATANTFATCTVSCTAGANTITACTAGSKSTYTAGTVISYSIQTACGTTNQIGTLNAQFTNP